MPTRFVRENAFLAAAVALPLVVVGFFLLATWIPRWTVAPPGYDLVFSTVSYTATRLPVSVEFAVIDGTLRATVRPAARDIHSPRPALWVFDHETMTVREIPVKVPDLAEAEQSHTMKIDGLAGRRLLAEPRAPDGYEVRSRDGSSPGIVGELFGMRRHDRGISLAHRGRVVSIDVPPGQDSLTPAFIGWLVDGER